MATKESTGNSKRFVIRLTGIEPGTRPRELASALHQLFRKKTLEEVVDLLNRLPLILASSATETQARKVHAFLKPKGAILKITPAAPPPTPAPKIGRERDIAIEEVHVSRDQSASNRETPLREERRAKPRVHPGIQIHPSSVREMLHRPLRLLRQGFWLFFVIMLIPQVVYFVMGQGASLVFSTSGEGTPGIGVFTVFTFIVFMMVQFWAQGALIFAVSETHLGHSTSIKASYRAIRKRLRQLLGTLILWGVLIVIWPALAAMLSAVVVPVLAAVGIRGTVLIVASVIAFVVSIWLALNLLLNWILVDKVVVIENVSWMGALRRSKELMSVRPEPGFWRRPKSKAVAILLPGFLIIVGIHFLCSTPGIGFGLLASKSVLVLTLIGLLKVIFTSLVSGYTFMVMILYYYDIRVRKEGFDLKMMAQNL